MKQPNLINRQITLAARPNGAPEGLNFTIEENSIPTIEKGREYKVEGLVNTIETFKGLLVGENFGKLIVQVGPTIF